MSDAAIARLLVLAVRDDRSPEDIRSISPDVRDWGRVAEQALAQSVTAYVRTALADAKIALATADDAALRDIDLAEVAGVLALDAALDRLLRSFDGLRIASIVLKGPVLARSVYPERSLRPYHDIDLVVRSDDLERAAAALIELGHVEIPYEAEEARHAYRLSGAEAQFHRMFMAERGGALVELHADPLQLGLRPVAEDERWRRAVSVPELGPGALALGDEDQVVHLCVHVHKHGFSRLIWLKDLDLIIRRRGPGLDWRLIEDVARREGVRSSVWYALSLASQMLGTPSTPAERMAPAAPIRALYELVWPRRRVAMLDATMRRRAVQFHVAESWRGMVPTLVLMGRRRERLGLLARSMFHRSTGSQPPPNGTGTT